MNDLKIAVAQFEHTSGDKRRNLDIIDSLARRASEAGEIGRAHV